MDPRLTGLKLHSLLLCLSDLLMPRVCLVCGRQLLPSERHLCIECEADLPLTHFETMPRNPMANAFNSRLLAAGDGAGAYQYATALFHYVSGSGYDYIPQALKYDRNFPAGRHFARLLGRTIASAGHFADVDLVCCVPLHWTRRFGRGYNQAEIIAREVYRVLSSSRELHFEPSLLRRTRRTRSQTRVGVEEKAGNVQGAFRARRGSGTPCTSCWSMTYSPPAPHWPPAPSRYGKPSARRYASASPHWAMYRGRAISCMSANSLQII